MRFALAVALVLASAGMAAADIYTWRDADGVRHFTNMKDDLPVEGGEQARVFIAEPAPRPEAVAPTADPPEPPAPPRQATVVYDRGTMEAAYQQGVLDGLERIQRSESAPSSPVTVQINGPFVAAAGGTDGYYPPYWHYPLVTTSFDRGRSRHMTLRMLLQDQFALDREGPFFVERFHGGAPLELQQFLPRGLPHSTVPAGLVVTH